MMNDFIEKMVRQEIKNFLAENETSIREMVRASLLPQTRALIRDEIRNTLGDLLERNAETVKRQAPIRKSPHAETIEAEIPESKPQAVPCNAAIGLYLYCIAEGAREKDLGNMGIEGARVYAIPFGDLSAIVHDCASEPYHSDDHDKVKAWALTHQKVVDAAWEEFGTVIPLGFDTIIQGKGGVDPKENVKKWIEADYENLTLKMARIRGKAEYGVQIFWETNPMAQKISAESLEMKQLQEEIRTKPRGIAYMYRQKLEELLRNEMAKNADRYFQEFYHKIRSKADDLHVEKTKCAEDEGRQMLLNLSCLLPKDRSQELGEALEEIDAREGFSVRFSGPWPPYSFV